ncbi:transposase [Streptomyces glaucescens]
MAILLTPGQWGDAPQMIEVLNRIRVPRPLGGRPRTRPDHISGDKAYSSRRNRRYLRRRHIKHTIPEPKDQRANRRRRGSSGGRTAGFDRKCYRRRNEVERTINRLKNSRAVATRYDKRAYVGVAPPVLRDALSERLVVEVHRQQFRLKQVVVWVERFGVRHQLDQERLRGL